MNYIIFTLCLLFIFCSNPTSTKTITIYDTVPLGICHAVSIDSARYDNKLDTTINTYPEDSVIPTIWIPCSECDSIIKQHELQGVAQWMQMTK
jgi:hypothetical protein